MAGDYESEESSGQVHVARQLEHAGIYGRTAHKALLRLKAGVLSGPSICAARVMFTIWHDFA